ncbi:MAG: hypothetical protein ABSH09_11535 [Bryobacteraceae bacterium]
MKILRFVFLAAIIAHTAGSANLAVSTFLRDGFAPAAIASDSAGDVYLAGNALTSPASQTTNAVVLKLDPKAVNTSITHTWTAPRAISCHRLRSTK